MLPPPDSEEFIFLARRVGYTTDDWQAVARHLERREGRRDGLLCSCNARSKTPLVGHAQWETL